jgi:Uma2 family endonuclease
VTATRLVGREWHCRFLFAREVRRSEDPVYAGIVLDLDSIARDIRPIRRSEFKRMGEIGLFEDERVELLEGVLVAMSPMGEPHADAIMRLNELLVVALRQRAWVRPQLPFAASELSQPEPDLAVMPREDGATAQDHPCRSLLTVEIAQSSLGKDQGIKAQIYALNGVPEYWIVNLIDSVIEVYTGPGSEGYRSVTRHGAGDRITLTAFPDVTIAVDDVLGSAPGA